ncbi:MAG TPA: GNAT family N-acetyltransferase [Pyrinomonadaceae bacterium]|nr:GNAT family N-acetyltransferase [Pyrinomonadaceae bacterium]
MSNPEITTRRHFTAVPQELIVREFDTSQSLNGLMTKVMAETPYLPEADMTVSLIELTEENRNEVLSFLSERPIHTVCLVGFVRDNGLVSTHNRGTFYGCRNSEGRLEGVALIGHATLIEARTARAMQEFSVVAQGFQNTHIILGETEKIEQFWNYYADEGQDMRLACREMLFEVRQAMQLREEIEGLRRATLNDLDRITPVQAGMAESESGVNPLEVDPEGFRARCARRIEMGRVWILEENGKLIFKADVQADTPDVIYLEGVWVNPAERSKGFGRKCMRQLCQDLLSRTNSVCVLVNVENQRAHTFYRMCNFKVRGIYDSIFLRRSEPLGVSN